MIKSFASQPRAGREGAETTDFPYETSHHGVNNRTTRASSFGV